MLLTGLTVPDHRVIGRREVHGSILECGGVEAGAVVVRDEQVRGIAARDAADQAGDDPREQHAGHGGMPPVARRGRELMPAYYDSTARLDRPPGARIPTISGR